MKQTAILILFVLLTLFTSRVYADAPLLSFALSPTVPILGQSSRLFVQWKTGFDKSGGNNVAPILKAQLDGEFVTAINPFGVTWIIDIPSFESINEHTISFELFLEDKKAADELRSSIETLEQEILQLNDAIANEPNSDVREELEAEREEKVVQKQVAEAQLPTTKTKVKDENFVFNVVSNLNLGGLFKNITLAQNRNVLIQNDDGGWNFFDAPDDIRNRGETSFPNQFGLHAQSMLEAYFVTSNGANLVAADRTATKIFNDPVGIQAAPAPNKPAARCVRSYSTDYEFLANAGPLLFPGYFIRGNEHFEQEKICFAALFLAGTTNQNDDALIDAVPQQDIDNLSDADRVAGFQARLVAANRNAGLRAFDWNSRIRGAMIFGDSNFAKAVANQIAVDASSIDISSDYYLAGLANTISSLIPFIDTEPSFQGIIDDAKAKLFAQQKPEGRFLVEATEGAEAGIVQDQAFILKALLDLGETEKAKKLVDFLLNAQLDNGAYDWFWEFGGNFEFVEGNSELLWAMSLVYRANAGVDNFLKDSRRNFVEKREDSLPRNLPKAGSYQ